MRVPGVIRHMHETTAEETLSCLDAPAVGAMLLTRELLPDLLRMPKASIVFVQSPAAYQPTPGATAYVVSLRRRMNTFIESPPHFARLVLGCIKNRRRLCKY